MGHPQDLRVVIEVAHHADQGFGRAQAQVDPQEGRSSPGLALLSMAQGDLDKAAGPIDAQLRLAALGAADGLDVGPGLRCSRPPATSHA